MDRAQWTRGRSQGSGSVTRLALEHVSKRFGARTILADQSIEFAEGGITVIRGRSGTGKTTVLNMLAGYCEPDEGQIVRPERLGYLLQEESLFSELSVRDNVLLRMIGAIPDGVEPDLRRLELALDVVGIAALGDESVAQLSGGERRRVEIAAILACDPDAVLLDEPATGLDETTKSEVYAALFSAFGDCCVVLVTHEETIANLPSPAEEMRLIDGCLSR